MSFENYSIIVKLSASASILMTIRSDYAPEDHIIVYADPNRLKPYMDKIVGTGESRKGKRLNAMACFEEAQINADTCAIITNKEFPIPLAKVNCHSDAIGFSDGITRTALLIELGAKFVPLQVRNEEAAMLHKLVGGAFQPEPASKYMVDSETRMDAMLKHYRI